MSARLASAAAAVVLALGCGGPAEPDPVTLGPAPAGEGGAADTGGAGGASGACSSGDAGAWLAIDIQALDEEVEASGAAEAAVFDAVGRDGVVDVRGAAGFAPKQHVAAYRHCRGRACRVRAIVIGTATGRPVADAKRDLGAGDPDVEIVEAIERMGLADVDGDEQPELLLLYNLYEKRVDERRIAILSLPDLGVRWLAQIAATPRMAPDEAEDDPDPFTCDYQLHLGDSDCDGDDDLILDTKCLAASCWDAFAWPGAGDATDEDAAAWADVADRCGDREITRAVYLAGPDGTYQLKR